MTTTERLAITLAQAAVVGIGAYAYDPKVAPYTATIAMGALGLLVPPDAYPFPPEGGCLFGTATKRACYLAQARNAAIGAVIGLGVGQLVKSAS